ncbi:hypothetical protein [Massilia sp. DWR3-1-1]|uniref:hypothetical protein n=1 Tax=Massilia sp. DWR3-1-1 TaxID=2804559 RepID=UPI003CE9ED9A
MRVPIAVAGLLLSTSVLMSTSVLAQTPPRPAPADMLRMADSSTAAALAALERGVQAQLNAQLTVAEQPETAERIASFKKNLFDALRKKGFTAEQSLQLVMATPLPALSK